jgi:hypothetical protein
MKVIGMDKTFLSRTALQKLVDGMTQNIGLRYHKTTQVGQAFATLVTQNCLISGFPSHRIIFSMQKNNVYVRNSYLLFPENEVSVRGGVQCVETDTRV